MQPGYGVGFLDRIPAPLAVLGAVISVQFGAALARDIFPVVGATGAVLLRVSIAIVCLWALIRPDILGLVRAHPRVIGLFGVTIALSTLFFYVAVSRVPLGVAIALEFVGPLGVAMWTSKRFIDRLWIVIAGLSIALLVPDIGTTLDPWGVAAALIAALFWGGYILLAPQVAAVASEYDGLVAALAVAWLCLLIPGIWQAGSALLSPHVLYQSIAMGILSAVIPFTCDFSALKRLPARTYGVLVCSEPIAGALVGYFWLHEALTGRTLGAIIGVTIASVGAALTHTGATHE